MGGGFGGLFAARNVSRAPVQVTLVDRVNHHLFQPLLYQVATGVLSEGEIAPPLRGVLHRHRNIKVELAEVSAFDLEGRAVTAMRGDGVSFELPYDSLIVAAGAGQSFFGHDEFSRWVAGMKTINDALELRGRILGAFEMAELERDPEKRRGWLTFVVVGGGPTGVEIAGQIAELSRRVLKDDFREIDSSTARVLLFDGGKEVLAGFGEHLSSKGATGPGASGCRDPHGEHRHQNRSHRRRREGGRGRAAHRGGNEGVGGRRPGIPARSDARGRRPARNAIAPVESRSCPTAPSPVIPRCSRSAT